MREPIIVTAFWDVGRSKDCEIPRTNDRYYREFAEWARIKNRLIVYTDNISSKIIKQIRKEYGLEEKTLVIVNDIYSIEPDIFKRMIKIESDKSFLDYRYRPEAMENKARFDYAWFMKYWCLSDAMKYVNEYDVLAWFDFGFNHIDRCYSNMNDFAFTWRLNKEINKVQAYSLRDVSSISVLDVLQFMQDTVMGVFYLVPARCAEKFWQLIKLAMQSLLMIGCIDDDQVLVLMAYKWNPDLIEINISKWWYLALKENGADNLMVEIKNEKKTLKHKLWAWRYNRNHQKRYLSITKKRMKKAVDIIK